MEQPQKPLSHNQPTRSSTAESTSSGWPRKLVRGAWVAIRSVLQFLVIAWGTLAIYYSNLPWYWMRLALAVAFAAFTVWALWITHRPKMRWALAAVLLGVVAWFISIPPSHDRPWRPEVAVMPRAIIDGDRVRMTGVRNFDFRSRDDFTPRYEEREFLISHATSLDLYISYWRVGPVGHTFVSFNFDDGTPPLCISIETRPEVGEGFAPIASMFKQLELIYVVGDEHDLVGLRVSHRDEETYLYRIRAEAEGVRRLLRHYLERINELADRPEWYHLLKNSCTINIIRYANVAGRPGGFDVRHMLNGWVDRYLYDAGWLDTTLPFAELRERSRITDVAKAAVHDPNFSQLIRASLPRPTTRLDGQETPRESTSR
jgi:hypothetical protein